jgi:hypothetical protein
VDGHEVSGQRDIVSFLQRAPSEVTVRLLRGEQELEVVLDYTDDPEEAERLEQRQRRLERGDGEEAESGDADDPEE